MVVVPPPAEDDRLLERLGQALASASLEPSARDVQRVRTAADQRADLGRAVEALGRSLHRRRPVEVARHATDVRGQLRRWEATFGVQQDGMVMEARQLLRQSRRFITSLRLPPVGSDGLTSSFL